jgi:hypothetical protein
LVIDLTGKGCYQLVQTMTRILEHDPDSQKQNLDDIFPGVFPYVFNRVSSDCKAVENKRYI